jgi:ATP-dependent RNA helicase DDX27
MKKLKDLDDEIEDVLKEEKEERALSITERDLKRGENLIKYEDEIKSRPRKTWFESDKEKKAAHQKGAAALNGPVTKEKKKLSGKDRKKLEINDIKNEGKVWKKGKAERGGKVTKEDRSKVKKAGKPAKGGKPSKGRK